MSQLGERLARAFAGRNVLELRGGDGQWTQAFAAVAPGALLTGWAPR